MLSSRMPQRKIKSEPTIISTRAAMVQRDLNHAAAKTDTPSTIYPNHPSGARAGTEMETDAGRDLTRVPVHASGRSLPEMSGMPWYAHPAQPSIPGLLARAASEPAVPLETGFRRNLEQHLDHDLSGVQVSRGPAAAQAADQLNARAYTLGNRIYLGSESAGLGDDEQAQLLAHEAIHTIQQGGGPVEPHPDLAVSSPTDAAEVEAERAAESFAAPAPAGASRSLAMRDAMRKGSGPTIARMVSPHVQRDLKGKHKAIDGTFDVNLKTESHAGAMSGMSGTIKFDAGSKAPDSKNIRLLQIVRVEDLGTGKDYVWTGDEADRNKVMTTTGTDKSVMPGFFVDHSAAAATPRTAKKDASVSPYYRTYWPNKANSQDGSKSGKTVTTASLWDYPRSSRSQRFTFETAAKAADTGYIYASLSWGFTVSDAAKGTVEKEHASFQNVETTTFMAAVEEFDKFYKNPGASTAP